MALYIIITLVVIIIAGLILFTAKRNKEIDENGIETNAVVTRVVEHESSDQDGFTTDYTYTYYVTYVTRQGQTVEAKLASGKSFDVQAGKAWDSDLREGVHVRIKYLPEKPNYVIRL